jgi:hypothetical protein
MYSGVAPPSTVLTTRDEQHGQGSGSALRDRFLECAGLALGLRLASVAGETTLLPGGRPHNTGPQPPKSFAYLYFSLSVKILPIFSKIGDEERSVSESDSNPPYRRIFLLMSLQTGIYTSNS